jgi:hypothetical protein
MMKTEIKRRSPVTFNLKPVKSEKRNDWEVALAYENEGDGPHLVDLSHCPRWDLQDQEVGKWNPLGVSIPEHPGESVMKNQVIINRMNGTQAAIWHLSSEDVDIPEETGYTDVTDASVFLAVTGESTFAIAEKLTALDLGDPAKTAPFLIQGPLAHVPCQIVVMAGGQKPPGMLLTCSRGYAHKMVEAILSAGHEFGLHPAGEVVFKKWLAHFK